MKLSAASLLMLTAFLLAIVNIASSTTTNELSVKESADKESPDRPRLVELEEEEEEEEEVRGEEGNDNTKGSMEMVMYSGKGKKKDKDNGLQKMYMIFMMCKSMVSTLLMFISPIIEVKTFGLNLITTLLDIARFIMQLKESKNSGGNGGGSSAYVSSLSLHKDPWGEEDRVGIAYRPSLSPSFSPSYFSHYPNYIHKYQLKS